MNDEEGSVPGLKRGASLPDLSYLKQDKEPFLKDLNPPKACKLRRKKKAATKCGCGTHSVVKRRRALICASTQATSARKQKPMTHGLHVMKFLI